jgi:asparagine synthase (glutamine-hydrolysing)
VIVHLYEEHGADCVRHLRGMFAFALWDVRRRRLLLARDRVGKKPLFYAIRNGTLWFGSETRAILEDPTIERTVDFDAIDSFLQFQYVPYPLSAFQALRKLPPAHTLVWEDGRAEVARYWKLSYRRGPIATEEEAHEAIRAALLEATRLRLRSDVPLGAFLSGGVDSSAVVAAMAKEGGRVKTFSIGFDVAEFDETPYAREVAQLYDTEHEELQVSPNAMEVLPRLVWHYGEPFADPSAIPSFYLAEMTRKHVTVALNGDGGDENFTGYRRHIGSGVAHQFGRLPWVARRSLAAIAEAVGPNRKEHSFRSRLHRVAPRSLLTPGDRYLDWISLFDVRQKRELYTPEFAAAVGEPYAPLVVREPFATTDAEDHINRMLDADVQTQLASALLVKMDIATMAHSLEVRSPLLDHEFMELAAGLPGAWKLEGRTTKKVFKDALRPWLPDHILHREKQGFGVPLTAWFRGELRELPREVLLDPRSVERGFFREEAVRRLIDRHVAGQHAAPGRIWSLIQLELWLRTFVDSQTKGPLALDVKAA